MKLVIALLLLCLATPCFADVTAEIVSHDLDEKGNIRVWAAYYIDGKNVKSEYDPIDGKYVYCTRYASYNFPGMTKEEVEACVLYQSKIYGKMLVKQEYIKKNITTNDDIVATKLDSIIGKTVDIDSMEIQIGDLKTIIVKTDGTRKDKSETVIAEPVIR